MKKVISIIVILILGLGAAAAYRFLKIRNQPDVKGIQKIHQEEGLPVRVFTVATKDLERKISVSGSIEAFQSVAIAAQFSERIETIHVKTGQKVAQGDLLVSLDAENANLAMEQAKASLTQAQEQLRKLENGSRPEEIQAAKAVRDEAEATLNLQKLEVERYQGLYQEQAATLQQLQTVENRYKRMQAALAAAQAQYDLMKQGPRAEDIAVARTQVALMQVALAQAKERLNDHFLRAPFQGVITMRQFEPGALVDFNQTIFNLLKIDPVYLVVKISELYIPQITIGMPVQVRIDALPNQTFTGKIARINPKAEDTGRAFITKIVIENPQGILQPGLFARAAIQVKTIPQAPVVPADAIRESQEKKFVWVVEDTNICQKREVTVGDRYDDKIHVLSGLEPGEHVITLAQNILESGMKVVPRKE